MNIEWSWNRFGLGVHFNPFRKTITLWLGFAFIGIGGKPNE